MTWSISSGSLPPGISINTGTGELIGVPSQAGPYAFVVQTVDAASGFSGSHRYFMNVGVGIRALNLPSGTHGTPYSQTLTTIGAAGATTWFVSSGALPPGLTLNTTTGVISGTPTT